MSNTSNNSFNQTPEKEKKSKQIDYHSKFCKDFADTYWNDATVVNSIAKDTNKPIDSSVEEKIKNLLAVWEYPNLDIEKIKSNIWKLQSNLISQITKQKYYYRNIEKKVLSTYKISKKTYSTLVENKIKQINSVSELDLYLEDSYLLEELLTDLIGEKPKSLELIDLFHGTDFFETIHRLPDNADAEKLKNEIINITKLDKSWELTSLNRFSIEISSFFTTVLKSTSINFDTKKSIVLDLIPYMWVKDAKKCGLISDSEIEIEKSKIIDEIKSDLSSNTNVVNINQKTTKKLEKLVNIDDIEINVEDFLKEWNLSNVIKRLKLNKTFSQIYKNINSIKQENKENNRWPKDIHSFKESVYNTWKLENPDFLLKNAFISLDYVKDGNKCSAFYKVIHDWQYKDDDGNIKNDTNITLELRWNDKTYNSWDLADWSNWNVTWSYNDFISFVKEWSKWKVWKDWKTATWVVSIDNIKCFKYESELIEELEENGVTMDSDSSDFKDNDALDAFSNLEKNKIIDDLLKENKDNENYWINWESTNQEIEDFISNDREAQERIKEMEERLDSYNYDHLIKKLNTFDEEWKDYWLDVSTAFISKKNYFYVKKLNKDEIIDGIKGSITISNSVWVETTVWFKDFFEIFRDTRCERTWSAKSPDELILWLKDHISEWNDFKIEWWKILEKDPDEKNDNQKDHNYIVWENNFYWDFNLIEVIDISWDQAEIKMWQVKDPEKKDNWDPVNKEEKGKEFFVTEKNSITVNISILESFIKKWKLKPTNLDKENEVDDLWDIDFKWDLLTRLWNMTSFADIISWSKLAIEWITDILKEGSDIRAAKFATWLPLPDSWTDWLKVREDQAGRKRMDDFVEKLEAMDSWDSTELIAKRLLNTNTSESQKEAAMIYMVKKYGWLYTKKALFKYQWKFLWYQALWGRINDDLYKEVKSKAKKSDVSFTEEDLVYSLIAWQCKWRLKPKRRWKLYKELEAIMWGGKKDEWEKWEKDAGKKRNVEDRVHLALDELAGWSYPNAMGALTQVINKWADWDITKLDKVPFVMLFSWLATTFPQDMVDKFKNLSADWRPLPSTFFCMNASKIRLYNDTVMELCKDIHNDWLYGDSATILSDAKTVFSKQWSPWNNWDKVWAAAAFYEKHGNVISRAMNQLATGQTDVNSIYETHISRNMDNPVYAKYRWLYKWVTADMTSFKDGEIMTDAYNPRWWEWAGWYTGMNTPEVISQCLAMSHHDKTFKDKKLGDQTWYEIDRQVNSLKNNKQFLKYWEEEWAKIQQEALFDYMKWIILWLFKLYENDSNMFKNILENWSWPMTQSFKNWWITYSDIEMMSVSWIKWNKYDFEINKITRDIIEWNNVISNAWFKPDVKNNVYEFKSKTSSLLDDD